MKYLITFCFLIAMPSIMVSQFINPENTKPANKIISIHWESQPNQTIYFGIHSDNTYLLDSLTLGSIGEGIFEISDNLAEGTYFIGFPKKTGFFDFIYDKKNIHIVVDQNNKPSFPDSKSNKVAVKYFETNRDISILQDSLLKGTFTDNAQRETVIKAIQKIEKERENFTANYIKEEPNSYFSLMLKLSQPADLSDLALKTKQDTIQYIYQRQNRYWNNVNFKDERIINNPLVLNLLDNYFDNVLPQNIDTLKVKAIDLIEKADSGSQIQHFFIASLMNKYISPKFIGLDAIFLEIYLKYIINQDNAWLGDENLKTAELKANQIYFNQLGKPGRDFDLLDIDSKPFKAFDYLTEDGLIMVFWDPSCSHCKIEIPRLDSLLKNDIKEHFPKLKILGVMVDGGYDNWKEFIDKNKLDNNLWQHGYDTKEMRNKDYADQRANFRQLYGIDQTPIFYYLNKDKIIQLKGPIAIEQLIQFLKSKLNPNEKSNNS